jgi:FkbM family methyltransferase
VFDVGASNGGWSSAVAELWPLATFHLFEPLAELPEYRQYLDWMSARTDVQATVHPVALDDAEHKSAISVSDHLVGSSLLADRRAPGFHSSVAVRTRTLDDYRHEHGLPVPELLKIDTQGLELRILQGAERTLPGVEVLLVETWMRRGYGPDTPLLHEVVAWLAARGFTVADFAGEYRDEAGVLFAKDLLFTRDPL